ncbi:MAG TPA: hypothetical protein VM143_13925 [Acidimicrobiales bacterium]|nr:hypothetical protein [Acidimicrobiales bacterium]
MSSETPSSTGAVYDETCMARALAVAAEGMARGEMPIGAVVAVDGEVVAEAHTQERAQRRLLVHADLLALDLADRRLRGRRSRATLRTLTHPPRLVGRRLQDISAGTHRSVMEGVDIVDSKVRDVAVRAELCDWDVVGAASEHDVDVTGPTEDPVAARHSGFGNRALPDTKPPTVPSRAPPGRDWSSALPHPEPSIPFEDEDAAGFVSHEARHGPPRVVARTAACGLRAW